MRTGHSLRMLRLATAFGWTTAVLACAGCSVVGTIFLRNSKALVSTPRVVAERWSDPVLAGSRLVITWVGHATMLVQMDDKFVVTDPVFTQTVGQFSRRLVEPGRDASVLPEIDAVLISHMHFDHFSIGSVEALASKTKRILIPRGGGVYVPELPVPVTEVEPRGQYSAEGLKITAVPVKHAGFRFGADAAWVTEGYTGWVIEYHGLTVYFAGDTAFAQPIFEEVARRFPKIDVALMPIGPVEPPEFARPNHLDGKEALQAFLILGATYMVPMHYDTFAHGIDEPGYALEVLRRSIKQAPGTEGSVRVLPIGGQLDVLGRGVETR